MVQSGDYDTRTAEIEISKSRDGLEERRERTRVRVPVLTLAYHPDFRRVGERLWLSALMSGATIEVSRLTPRFSPPGSGAGHSLGDPYISRTPFHVRPLDDGALEIVKGETKTEIQIDGEQVTDRRRVEEAEIDQGVVLVLSRRVVLLLHTFPPLPQEEPPRFGLVGDSEAILRLRQEIDRVADLEVPVLLRGATGTGKELAAKAIHGASRRRERSLVSVNMAAIPGSLAASELFGAVKGAFTGSDRTRRGYFRKADGGTLFLDEVGEAPPEVQVMLLRVLETGEIQSVGAADHQEVDVRVLAATDANLEEAIDEGSFRAPLLHRLAGFSIRVPALQERRDDIGRLLMHFLRQELTAVGEEHRLLLPRPTDSPWLPASVVARLLSYSWPGNVRELRNLARQLVIASRGSDKVEITPEVEHVLRSAEAEADKAAEQRAGAEAERGTADDFRPVDTLAHTDPEPEPVHYRSPQDVSKDELLTALRRHRWTVKPTAEDLGISRASLYNLIERTPEVRKASDLERDEILAAREAADGNLDAMVDALEVSRRGLEMRMKELELT